MVSPNQSSKANREKMLAGTTYWVSTSQILFMNTHLQCISHSVRYSFNSAINWFQIELFKISTPGSDSRSSCKSSRKRTGCAKALIKEHPFI